MSDQSPAERAEKERRAPGADKQARRQTAAPRELWLRIVSGLVLAVVALGLTYLGLWPFTAFIIAWGAVMAWEWGCLVRGDGWGPLLLGHVVIVALAATAAAAGAGLLALLLVLGCGLMLGLWRNEQRMRLSGLGVLYIGLPSLALVWLRSDAAYGWWAIIFIFAVVWATDVGAYAVGRTLGGPKLVPRISPNKTWSGFLGGVLSGAAAGALCAALIPGAVSGHLALLGIALSLVAQWGDMAESLLKRRFGVKDSSGLIPGHGGLLDRVDGLVPAAVLAAAIALVVEPAAPGEALLLAGLLGS